MVGVVIGQNIWTKVRHGDWLKSLPPELERSALSAYGMRLVHGVQVALLEDRIQIRAQVAARVEGDLSVRVEVFGFRLEQIRTWCSCTVGRNCRHCYAALLASVSPLYTPREDLPQASLSLDRYLDTPLWKPGGAGKEWDQETDRSAGAAAGEPEVSLPAGVPQPQLRLLRDYPFTGYLGWYSGISYGETIRLAMLEFTYAEAPGEVFGFGADKMRFSGWRRDAAAERGWLEELEASGLQRCGAVLNHALQAKYQDALLFYPQGPSAWEDFLIQFRTRVSEGAWSLSTEPSFDLEIVETQGYYEEITATPGTDWLEADIGVETPGGRVPLLPLLVQFLKQDKRPLNPEELLKKGEKPILIPLGDGRSRIPVPAARLYRILTSLTELFSPKTKLNGSRLSMHRLDAAGYLAGGLDDPRVQTTAGTLKSLVAYLKAGPHAGGVAEEPPAGLQASLRPYQLQGFQWLRGLAKHRLGGILADDMGLGKTLQTLAHLLAEVVTGAAEGRPSLIVCPVSVLHNWQEEAVKFTPSLRVHLHYGANRKPEVPEDPRPDLVLTSYPLLVKDIEFLAALELHVAVLDEAQFIKNPRTQAAISAGKLQARQRIALTGTPMENHLGELWSILHFLMPGYLGSREGFNRTFRNPIVNQQDAIRKAQLNQRLSPVFLRRTKQEVLPDLPPRIDLMHRVVLPPAQADLYESVRAAMNRQVREEIDRRGVERSHIVILEALLKLRQVCCHPGLLSLKAAQEVRESAKLEYFLELVAGLLEEGRRILVFSQFVQMLKVISGRLTAMTQPHLSLTGESKNRADLVRQFQSGAVPLFLISLKAGGTGLNLTAADTVIHYDPWWNPAVEAQATDRAHRIGQQHTVFVHKLICEGTIEEKILALQERKSALVQSLLEARSEGKAWNENDLQDLLAPME